MDTSLLKEELHQLIEKGDESFVKNFYKLAKLYLQKSEMDKMIMDGEADIKAGRIYSSEEMKDFIDSWNWTENLRIGRIVQRGIWKKSSISIKYCTVPKKQKRFLIVFEKGPCCLKIQNMILSE